MRLAKTQISLGICPVWSESSLFAWRNLGSSATHWAHSEDWSDSADDKADPRLRWAHRSFFRFCHTMAQIVSDQTMQNMAFDPGLHVYRYLGVLMG